jgi:single-strand DNA-binding protein
MGKIIVRIKVLTSLKWKDKKTGQTIEACDLHQVVLFNKDAELVGSYLKQGAKIYIEGKIKTNISNNKGRQVKAFEVHASEMLMLDTPPSKRMDAGEIL